MVGNFEVPVTASLRELFSRTHDKMSGSKPDDQQYPHDEQYEMYLACEVTADGDDSKIDTVKTEKNLLELIHYLNENGLAIPCITAYARCFSTRTRGVATRLHLKEVRERQAEGRSALLFLAPAKLKEAVA